MMKHVTLLLRLFRQPGSAMSAILDEGSLLFASAAVLIVSLLLRYELPWAPVSFYTPLLLLAAVYVPGALLLTSLLGRLGSFGTVFQRDYSPLLTCTSMAWAASQIPLALVAPIVPVPAFVALAAASCLYFAILMFFAVRTVFGVENGIAAGAVCLSWVPLAAAVAFWEPLRSMVGWLASPFFLFYAYWYLGGELSNLGSGLRGSRNFRRMLEAAALNPHDAEARYQLGLIYQQRRQYTAAVDQFEKAVAIDPAETDAHFQLGRIARQQGRLKDAFAHFQKVFEQNEKHSSSEILRELGAIYLSAKQYEDARRELAIYVERRPYDPEGLFYYAQALEQLGDLAGSRELYGRAVEAAHAAPHYRRRYTAKWSRLAQKQAQRLARP